MDDERRARARRFLFSMPTVSTIAPRLSPIAHRPPPVVHPPSPTPQSPVVNRPSPTDRTNYLTSVAAAPILSPSSMKSFELDVLVTRGAVVESKHREIGR